MHAMILSHLTYCITSWSQASASTIKALTSFYNQAIKVLDKKPLRSHHCNVLKKCNLLSFDNFLKYSNLTLTFECLHHLAPPTFLTLS